MLKRSLVFQFFSLFLFVNTVALAQKDSIRVRVFDGAGTETEKPTKVLREYEDKNFVSFNLYLPARGACVISYERALSRHHTLVFNAGLTYRDFIYEGLEFSDDDGNKADVTVGHYLEFAYKLYPKEYQDFDGGFYLSPGIINRTYNVHPKVGVYNGVSTELVSINNSYSVTDLSLKMGYVRESTWIDNLITDIYFGVGGRQINSHSYELVSNGPGEKVVVTRETKKLPAVYLGVKIGFTF